MPSLSAFAERDVYTRRVTRVTARAATATQAAQLRVPEGAALLRSIAVNTDPEGTPVEFGTTWFAGDRVTLTVSEPSEGPDGVADGAANGAADGAANGALDGEPDDPSGT